MSRKLEKLQFVIGLIDKISNPITRIQQRLGGLMSLGAKAGGVLGGVGMGVGLASATKVSASYEDMQASLEGVSAASTDVGKALDAKNNFDYIRQFAANAPAFGIQDTATAFLQLKGAGIDPMLGGLKSLGDAASALNKPFDAASQMITDSIMGENERLKEFLVTAEKNTKQGLITYSYMNKLGQQMKKTARLGDQAGIANTIFSIMDDKYGGASAKKAETFNGKLANLKDTLAGLQHQFMSAGMFDAMKAGLQKTINLLTRLSESGAVERWGQRAAEGAKAIGAVVDTISQKIGHANDKLSKFMGGWGNLGRALGLIKEPVGGNNGLPSWLKPTDHSSGQLSPLLAQLHTVKQGDSLWSIAKQMLGQGSQYQQIADLNKEQLPNVNHILPGQQLKIAAGGSRLPAWMQRKPASLPSDNMSPVPQSPLPMPAILELAKTNKVLAAAVAVRLAWDKSLTAIKASLSHVKDKAGEVFNKALDYALDHSAQIAIAWGHGIQRISQLFDRLKNGVKATYNTLTNYAIKHKGQFALAFQVGSGLAMGAVTRLPMLIGLAMRGLGDGFKWVSASAKTYLPQAKSQLGSIYESVLRWFGKSGDKLSAVFSPLVGTVLKPLGVQFDRLAAAAQNGRLHAELDNMLSKVQPLIEKIKSFSGAVRDFVVGVVTFVGGWDQLAALFAAGWMIAKLSGFLQGLAALGGIIAFLATPVGLLVLLLGAMAVSARLLYLYWDSMSVSGKALALAILAVGTAIFGTLTYLKLVTLWTQFMAAAAIQGSIAQKILAAATWLWNGALAVLTSPITLVIAAIAALAVGAYYLYTHWAQVKSYLGETEWGQVLLGVINALIHPLDTLNTSVAWLDRQWTSTKASLSETTWGQMILGAINGLFSPFETFKTGIAAAHLVWDGIKNSLNDTSWGQAIIATVEKIMSVIGNFQKAYSFVKNAAGDIAGGALDGIKGAGNWALSKLGMGDTTTPTFGGGRAVGGLVRAGNVYRINERVPEILQQGGASYLLNDYPGRVVPLTPIVAPPQLTDRLTHNRVTHSTSNNNMASVTHLTDRLANTRMPNHTVNDPTEALSARVNESQAPLREIVQGRSPTQTGGLRNLINHSVSNRERLLMQNSGGKRIQIGTVHLHINGEVDAERLIHELEMAS